MMPKTRKQALLDGVARYYTGTPCLKGHIAPRRARTGECLACRAEYLAEWRNKNPARVKAHNDTQHAKFAPQLAERAKKYYYRDVELSRKKLRDYQKQNLHKFAQAGAKRKSAKLQRTPSWLTEDDHWMMEQAYELAALRTKMFGFSWHVDHKLPLQGKIVSGLHTPYNLQVIPAVENIRKGNRV